MPSLMALRAFDVASRTNSFVKAAEELLLTQSAVSRHIRNLEEELGMRLFRRVSRGVALSPEGERLKTIVTDAFDRLDIGINSLRASQRASALLTVSMLPSFAAKWLAPRIGAFSAAFPDIELRLSCTRALTDFDDVDAAIRYGRGNWPGCTSIQLADELVFPVMSPCLRDRFGPLDDPEVLSKMPLLQGDIVESWQDWFNAAGLVPPSLIRGIGFSDDTALIQAAIDGHGVALGRSILVARDIAEGRLIAPFDARIKADYAYWFVVPNDRTESRSLSSFLGWLKDEFYELGSIL
uniref:Transcriptional regulator, LysR family n=2 Tax=root TaxID=1 RepID=E6PNE5_9ZZZZ